MLCLWRCRYPDQDNYKNGKCSSCNQFLQSDPSSPVQHRKYWDQDGNGGDDDCSCFPFYNIGDSSSSSSRGEGEGLTVVVIVIVVAAVVIKLFRKWYMFVNG